MQVIEPLARFSTHAEHLALIQGLLRERNLRVEIRRLQVTFSVFLLKHTHTHTPINIM